MSNKGSNQGPVRGRGLALASSASSDNNESPSSDSDTNDNDNENENEPGDSVRLANNIRPSLNPTIINTISNALLQRSTTKSSYIPSTSSTPIEIMTEAAKLASEAIQSRALSSTQVKGDNGAFNQEECQLVAGRIVGVCMRLGQLEDDLMDRINDPSSSWVKKYSEEYMFGVCSVELEDGYKPSDIGNGSDNADDANATKVNTVLEKIKDDPLLRMNRAECLYALFLKNIEMPSMAKIGQIPVDAANSDGNGGGIDFIDAEKMEVLFPNGFE
jgi:hypothetical protein